MELEIKRNALIAKESSARAEHAGNVGKNYAVDHVGAKQTLNYLSATVNKDASTCLFAQLPAKLYRVAIDETHTIMITRMRTRKHKALAIGVWVAYAKALNLVIGFTSQQHRTHARNEVVITIVFALLFHHAQKTKIIAWSGNETIHTQGDIDDNFPHGRHLEFSSQTCNWDAKLFAVFCYSTTSNIVAHLLQLFAQLIVAPRFRLRFLANDIADLLFDNGC